MTLISLVGEQPTPIILAHRSAYPDHHLLLHSSTTRRVAHNLVEILPETSSEQIPDYDLTRALEKIKSWCTPRSILNLTGGTKPMALAAYEAARSRGLQFLYLQSEGKQSVLYRYTFKHSQPLLEERAILPALINIEDYLGIHGLFPNAEKGPMNEQEAGLRSYLEKQVAECRTNLIFDAFEIDFILRRCNQVAVIEAKMTAKNTREGIDQLNTYAGREYLGTYTGKILVVQKPLGPQLSRLAEARHINVVLVQGKSDARSGLLLPDPASRRRLSAALNHILGLQSAIQNPQSAISNPKSL